MKRINQYFVKKENKKKVPNRTEDHADEQESEYNVDNPSGKC